MIYLRLTANTTFHLNPPNYALSTDGTMSVQLAAQDFTTPAKGGPNSKLDTAAAYATANDVAKAFTAAPTPGSTTAAANSVTPTEAGISSKKTVPAAAGATPGNVGGNKHVHFGAEGGKATTSKPAATESPASGNTTAAGGNNKRGLVSRRGGRYVSPGRPITGNNTSTPTLCTPSSKSVEGTDGVPPLCSTNSVGLVSLPSSECDKDAKEGGNSDVGVKVKREAIEGVNQNRGASSKKGELAANPTRRPTSISCDPSSLVNITSPLAKSSPRKEMPSFDDSDAKLFPRSPVPSASAASDRVSGRSWMVERFL